MPYISPEYKYNLFSNKEFNYEKSNIFSLGLILL